MDMQQVLFHPEGGSHLKPSKTVRFIRILETVVLTAIAIVLVILAIILLCNSVIAMWHDLVKGTVAHTGIEILNSILLVMMIMEIVYTVTMSLESHSLVAEPFLIIGAIAAIRRMLVITAESTRLELSNPAAFQSLLMELGLLGLLVLVMAVSIFILKRRAGNSSILQESEEPDQKHK